MFYYDSFVCLTNMFFFLISKIFLSIYIIKNAMLSRHNFILGIAVHIKCNQGVEKLSNKFSLL